VRPRSSLILVAALTLAIGATVAAVLWYQSQPDEYQAFLDSMAKVAELKDKMCACLDAMCARGVDQELTAWTREANETDRKSFATPEDIAKVAEIRRALDACRNKASGVTSAAPSAPRAP
jgi:hypothetical protein